MRRMVSSAFFPSSCNLLQYIHERARMHGTDLYIPSGAETRLWLNVRDSVPGAFSARVEVPLVISSGIMVWQRLQF